MALFEDFEGRIPQVNKALKEYGFAEGEKGLNEARDLCKARGFDPYEICQSTQQICFEDAKWAYVLGSAIAIKEAEKTGDKTGSTAAANIGKGLQAFCLPGSVADDRKVGLGHGNLGARLLSEETQCFAFLAGHESFAAAEGAIKIAANANKVRKNKLRVI
ncbi:GGGtGRT protein, partial [uncultured Treponema sp.]